MKKHSNEEKGNIKNGITIASMGKMIPIVFWCFIALVVVIAGVKLKKSIGDFFSGKKGITLVSETNEILSIQDQLKKVLDVDNIYTCESVQNNVIEEKSKKGKVKYTAKYEGLVRAGIDPTKIQVNVNDDKKLIMITVPKIEFEYNVVAGSTDYLNDAPMDKDDEVREKCLEDLHEKTDEERMTDTARETARTTINKLAELVLKSDEYKEYSDYTINLYNRY